MSSLLQGAVAALQNTVATTLPLSSDRPSSPSSPTQRQHNIDVETAAESAAEESGAKPRPKSQRPSSQNRENRRDPLRVLPPALRQRVFLSLGIDDLFRCSLVSRHWHRSATLNYCWFMHVRMEDEAPVDQSGHLGNARRQPELPPLGASGAKWTRQESKVDWRKRWLQRRRRERRDDQRAQELGESLSASLDPQSRLSRSQRLADAGVSTAHMRNEDKWEAEERAAAQAGGAAGGIGGYSKEEMRQWYKEQGGAHGGKLKGKRAKGGVKTGALGDGGLWE